jgi:chaperone modulatory protein CbpM
MMLSKQEFLVRAPLERETLEAWIQEEWLIPGQSAGELTFSDADIARALKILRKKQRYPLAKYAGWPITISKSTTFV